MNYLMTLINYFKINIKNHILKVKYLYIFGYNAVLIYSVRAQRFSFIEH